MGTIVEEMRAAAAPGQLDLDAVSMVRLKELTAKLIVARRDEAVAEYERFLSVVKHEICLPHEQLAARLSGTVILVIGGTGCIGTALVTRLAEYKPTRIVSVSRGVNRGWPRRPGVDYVHADIGDQAQVDALISETRPDVIFHLAGQRFPGLAETLVQQTLRTNLLGTRNVLAAAAAAGTRHVVCASTGKALRPFSPDVYTASKRVMEWVAHGFAASGAVSCSAVRFTHVVNNSDIHKRLREWADESSVVRLHSSQIMFYVQSAAECAQLLLSASLDNRPGELLIHAINDLGWPVSLLDLAVGALVSRGSDAPIYFSGYDPGYEEIPFPGLYDPTTAGEVSPLINAFEAAVALKANCPTTDAFVAAMEPGSRTDELFEDLKAVCHGDDDPHGGRAALRELSWAVLDSTLAAVPPDTLNRVARITERHSATLIPDHQRILKAIKDRVRERSARLA